MCPAIRQISHWAKMAIFTRIDHFRAVTPVWIHWWLWNNGQCLTLHRGGALLFFEFTHLISRSHGMKNKKINPRFLGQSQLSNPWDLPFLCTTTQYRLPEMGLGIKPIFSFPLHSLFFETPFTYRIPGSWAAVKPVNYESYSMKLTVIF